MVDGISVRGALPVRNVSVEGIGSSSAKERDCRWIMCLRFAAACVPFGGTLMVSGGKIEEIDIRTGPEAAGGMALAEQFLARCEVSAQYRLTCFMCFILHEGKNLMNWVKCTSTRITWKPSAWCMPPHSGRAPSIRGDMANTAGCSAVASRWLLLLLYPSDPMVRMS